MSMMTVDTIEEREKLIKEIARTSKSIRKKYRMLKTGRMEEEAELEKQFKPIVEPLKQIAENIRVDEPHEATVVTPSLTHESKNKRKRWSSEKKISKRINTSSASPIQTSTPLQPRELMFEPSKNLLTENVFETSRTNSSLVTSVRQTIQTFDGQEALYSCTIGPTGAKVHRSALER
jgi:vancomycin resistance protein YoaR